MSNLTFRIFNPRGSKEDRIEKRRSQLRKAQQTYRERRDNYTKSLEEELARSRANEARLMIENEQLQSTVKAFSDILSKQGLDLPGDLRHGEEHVDPVAGYATTQGMSPSSTTSHAKFQPISGENGHAALLPMTPSWTSPTTASDYQSSPVLPEPLNMEEFQHQGFSSGIQGDELSYVPTDPRGQSNRVCDMDLVAVGMEFVLGLERPCLGHIHGNPDQPHAPNGHALTTSAQVLCILPQTESNSGQLNSVPFQKASANILDHLLSLAPIVSSYGETTPIQAWQYIRSQPYFAGLEMQSLHALGEKLRRVAKCHGFGAVIESTMFESLILDTFRSDLVVSA